jgi:hypothetical protein
LLEFELSQLQLLHCPVGNQCVLKLVIILDQPWSDEINYFLINAHSGQELFPGRISWEPIVHEGMQ